MIKWLFKWMFLFAIIAAILFFTWRYIQPYINIQRQAPQATDIAASQAVKPLEALVIQQDTAQAKRFLRCTAACQPEPIPHSLDSDALTDGQAWYYYQTDPATAKTALVRFWPQKNETKVIAQETDLIKPRGLYLNPAGTKLAYFLDNINEPDKRLTEIWLYDTISQSVSLGAQNVHQPDLLTRPRWNSTGTTLWFVADSGAGETSKIELVTVAPDHPAQAAFQSINWQPLQDIADHGVMDISQAGNAVAYVKRSLGVFDRLVVSQSNGSQYGTSVIGSIPYLEWLPDNTLLYASQDAIGFTFWRVKNDEAVIVASQRGVLRSARSDSSGQSVAFAADTGQGSSRLFALHLPSRTIKEQARIPDFGSRVFVVAAKESSAPTPASVASVTAALADDQIAAFIDANLNSIVQAKAVQKIRLIITDQPNTVFVDYQTEASEPKRILLTVNDAVNTEWSIRGRYEAQNGQWQKVQGGGISDPKPLRLYEWEDSLKKWVLKQEISQ